MEKQHCYAYDSPDEVVELGSRPNFHSEKHGTGDTKNTVGTTGQPAHIIDECNPDNFYNADCHDKQVVPPKMNNGTGHHKGKQGGRSTCYREQKKNGNLILSIQNGRDIGPYGIKGRMPHMKDTGLPENKIQRQGKQCIKTYAYSNFNPVDIKYKRQQCNDCGQQKGRVTSCGIHHSLSATLSPSSPVGRMIRMRMRTRKAMASFQAIAR